MFQIGKIFTNFVQYFVVFLRPQRNLERFQSREALVEHDARFIVEQLQFVQVGHIERGQRRRRHQHLAPEKRKALKLDNT